MKEFILSNDYKSIEQMLLHHQNLANEGMVYDAVNTAEAHPLHRICDGVFSGKYTDEEAVEIAKILIRMYKNINAGRG
jgi:uncharacterized protein